MWRGGGSTPTTGPEKKKNTKPTEKGGGGRGKREKNADQKRSAKGKPTTKLLSTKFGEASGGGLQAIKRDRPGQITSPEEKGNRKRELKPGGG